jgi:hypothetical protein
VLPPEEWLVEELRPTEGLAIDELGAEEREEPKPEPRLEELPENCGAGRTSANPLFAT